MLSRFPVNLTRPKGDWLSGKEGRLYSVAYLLSLSVDKALRWTCAVGGAIILYTLLSQMELFPWEIRVAFPLRKPAAKTESRYPTLINYKEHAGYFPVSIIHRTLIWTAVSLTCARSHSCYTRTPTASQHNIFDSKKTYNFVLFSGRDSNLSPLDLESDALPIEPPRHPK